MPGPISSPTSATYASPHRQYDNIFFDLTDTLFTSSSDASATTHDQHPSTPLSSKALHSILRSDIWFDYEKGRLTQDECYTLLASRLSLRKTEIALAIQTRQASLRADPIAFTLLRDFKRGAPGVRFFAMANLSAPDWEALQRKISREDRALFDHVFTSAEAKERMPNLGFYRYVIKRAAVDLSRTIFVGDKVENVVSAMSCGMTGVPFSATADLPGTLLPLLRDPVADALRWLRQHAGRMMSVTNTGVVLEENFGQLLMLELTQDPDLVSVVLSPRLTNFFQGEGVLTTSTFPYDLDTTSIACSVLDHFTPEVKNDIMDEMLDLRSEDGIIQTYFDKTRPRIDPIVCVNVLTFFHLNGRGHEPALAATLDWVHAVLHRRAYVHGTLYYQGGDAFLYFLSRLLRAAGPLLQQRLLPLFAARVRERLGQPGDALALAMRVLAAAAAGAGVLGGAADECERLRAMQAEDGAWPAGWVYKYGATGVLIGNQGLTTAMAAAALRVYEEGAARGRAVWFP